MYTHLLKTESDKTQDVTGKTEQIKTVVPVPAQRTMVDSGSLFSPPRILQLQRMIGNQAVIQLLKSQLPQQSAGQPVQLMESETDEDNLQMKKDSAVQMVNNPAGNQITNIRMGDNFYSRHVAANNQEREACAAYRREVDHLLVPRNTTASEADWRTAVNNVNANLNAGRHNVPVTVNCVDSTWALNINGDYNYTHSPAANQNKTLGINVQRNNARWRLFINHVH